MKRLLHKSPLSMAYFSHVKPHKHLSLSTTMRFNTTDGSALVFSLKGEDEFKKLLEESSRIPVLLDCYADWCGPCKMLTPELEDVVNAKNGAIKLAKVDVDLEQNMSISQGLRVSGIPAVFLLKDGKIIGNFVGYRPKQQIEEFLHDKLKI